MILKKKIPRDFYKLFRTQNMEYYMQLLTALYEADQEAYALTQLTDSECRSILAETIARVNLVWWEDETEKTEDEGFPGLSPSAVLDRFVKWGWLSKDFDEKLNCYIIGFPEYSRLYVELFDRLEKEDDSMERESILSVYSALYTYDSDPEKNNSILKSALRTSKSLGQMLSNMQDSLRLWLFHSATIYFVFISGYLFDFVNRRKGQFSPLRFYKSKIVNVFCPYFILSLLLLAAGWISHHWFGYDIPFINDGTPVASLWDVLRCLAYGSASLVPYWYIPFIMTVFSVGPLIFHLPTGLLQKILLPASVLPLMVPRLLVSPLRNLCFFVPIFLMGVYCARNRDACMAFIRRHLSAIRVTAVLTSLLIVADHYFGSFMPNIEGAYYVQKLCIGSWVLELLEGMDREVLALDFLARYSFPLFFLHAIFQGIFQAPLFQVLGAALPGQVFTIANLTVTVEIALCILCILGIKKIMGKRSRYLIGG